MRVSQMEMEGGCSRGSRAMTCFGNEPIETQGALLQQWETIQDRDWHEHSAKERDWTQVNKKKKTHPFWITVKFNYLSKTHH